MKTTTAGFVLALTLASDVGGQAPAPLPQQQSPAPSRASPSQPGEQAPAARLPEKRPAVAEPAIPKASEAKPAIEQSAGESPRSEAELKPLVAMVEATIGGKRVLGAGVLVAQRNDRIYIATANHVVRATSTLSGEDLEAEHIDVRLSWLTGERVPATLLDKFDQTLDLAVLAVRNTGQLAVPRLAWAALVNPESLAPGEQVIPIGNPEGNAWFVPQRRHVVSSVTAQTIRTEGDLVRGQSGGALVTEDWGIAAIVGRAGTLVGESTRIDLIVKQLTQWGFELDATFKARSSRAGGREGTVSSAADREAAVKLATRWVDAMIAGNLASVENMIDTPFYFDNEILTNEQAVLQRLKLMLSKRPPNGPTITIQSVKARTIGESREAGLLRGDRFNNMSLVDTDWLVVVTAAESNRSSTDATVFLIRNVNGTLKLLGFWG